MRADRLLSIVLLLQVHTQMTARELADRLEVSERTILRDMEALSASGIPVVAERGSGGGWKLMEGYQTRLTGLRKAEILALFSTQPVRLLKDLGLHKAAESGQLKLLSALPAMYRQDAEYVRQRIHIDMSGWQRDGEKVQWLPLLQDAVLQECKIRILYQRGDGTSVNRLVCPLGLVAKGGAWYLIVSVEDEFRTYRVSRIREVVLTGESFERPESFDLPAFWEQASSDFVDNLPKYPVTVRVAPSILYRLKWAGRFARIEQTDAPDEEGWTTMKIRFESEQEACEYVLSFGSNMEIIEPDELRMKVTDSARSVVRFYENKNKARKCLSIKSNEIPQ